MDIYEEVPCTCGCHNPPEGVTIDHITACCHGGLMKQLKEEYRTEDWKEWLDQPYTGKSNFILSFNVMGVPENMTIEQFTKLSNHTKLELFDDTKCKGNLQPPISLIRKVE